MAVDTRNQRASMMSAARPWLPRLPLPDGSLANAGDRAQLGWRYRGIEDAGAGPLPSGAGGDWLTSEIGRWVRNQTDQFDGHPTLARWRAEAEAAALAGAPYPWFTSELQRRFLDYFISIQ